MEFKEFIRIWPKQKLINGKSFDDLFQIEEVPFSWFYNRFFLILPAPINTFKPMEKRRKLTIIEKMKYSLAAKVMTRYIFRNEKKKIKYLRDKNGPKNDTSDRKKAKKKVLFLTYTNHICQNGEIFRIQNVLRKIRENGRIGELVLFADPLSSKNYKKLRDYNSLYNYFDQDSDKKAKELSALIFNQWKNLSIRTKKELLTWERFSLWPYLQYAFEVLFSKQFLYLLVLYYELFKKIIKEERIGAIVLTGQSSLFDKCAIAAARNTQCPIFRIQHGIGEGVVPPDGSDDIYKLVFSKSVKNALINVGWKKEQIIIVGPVIFDPIVSYRNIKKEKEMVIMVATTASVQSNIISSKDYFIRIGAIFKSLIEIPRVKLIIKLHPRETPYDKSIQKYKEILKKLNFSEKNYQIYPGEITREEFYSLISKSDVFVNFGSAACIEALLINKPVLNIDIFGNKLITGWAENKKITINLNYDENLKKAVEDVLKPDPDKDLKIKHFLEEKCGKVDGKAHERAVKVILKKCLSNLH